MSILTTRMVELQQQNNLLKKDVASALGVSIMAYYRYEKGERSLNAEHLIALADLYNVSLDYLVGRTDNPEINE